MAWAKIEPIMPYWANTSGLQSTFSPTSSSRTFPPVTVGATVEIVGRITPSIGLTACIEPTIIAPVLPALAKPLMSPFARWLNPTTMLELVFCWKALAG